MRVPSSTIISATASSSARATPSGTGTRRATSRAPAAQSDAAFTAGLRRVWSELAATGVPTVVLADVPVMRVRVPECVSAHLDRLTRCASPRAAAIARSATALQFEAARDLPGVTLVDLNDAVCPADPCAPVISEMLVYRDSNHLTATYMRSLAPRLAAALGRPG